MIRWQTVTVALCALSLAVPCTKADEDPVKKPEVKTEEGKKPDAKKPDAKKGAPKVNGGLFRLPDSIALSDDQKAKLAEIQKEFEPKLAEIAKKADVLTDEQKETMKKVSQEAKKSGKKGKELQAELDTLLKLTDEQKKLRIEAKEQSIAIQKQVRERVVSVLFEDQKKVLEESMGKKKKAKPDSAN